MAALTLWTITFYLITGLAFVFYSGSYVAVVCLAIVCLLAIYAISLRAFSLGAFLLLAGLLILPSVISLLANGADTQVWLRPLLFTALVGSAYLAGATLDGQTFVRSLQLATVSGLATAPLAASLHGWDLASAALTGKRLIFADGFQPNTLGLMFLALAISSAIAFRSYAKWLAIALCFAGSVATSSRAAMISIIVVALASELLTPRGRTRLAVVGLIGSISLALSPIGTSLLDSLFHLSDPLRGISSGGSGRLSLWDDYITLWMRQPIFGLGLDARIMRNGTELYTHNLLLQLLVDAGIINLVCFSLFISSLLYLIATDRSGDELRNGASICLAGYLSYGIFEGRTMNVGNSLSCLVFVVLFAYLGSRLQQRTPSYSIREMRSQA